MNKSVYGIVIAAVVVMLGSALQADARPGRKAKFKHADKNKDGKISRKEFVKEKQFTRRAKSKVNTKREEKMDTNDDGVVSRKEAGKARTKAYLDKRSDVNRAWETKADTDGDGKVSLNELKSYRVSVMDGNGDGAIDKTERRRYWISVKSKVNTEREEKYDADGDGYISGDEAEEMLRDVLRVINTHGRAKVNTDLEASYDADGDGVISREEAQLMRDALGI